MVAAAMTAMSNGQFTEPGGIISAAMRYRAANAPILGTVVTNAATTRGAPSVTSGTQKCPGTAPVLKVSPASSATTPTATAPAGAPAHPPRRGSYDVPRA